MNVSAKAMPTSDARCALFVFTLLTCCRLWMDLRTSKSLVLALVPAAVVGGDPAFAMTGTDTLAAQSSASSHEDCIHEDMGFQRYAGTAPKVP